MRKPPELLLRKSIVDEFKLNAIQIDIEDLRDVLKSKPGVWWNAYSQKYGIEIKEFPYPARNGFFIDTNKKVVTHRFVSKGIARRDLLFDEDDYQLLIPDKYKKNWFDYNDAFRCYSILITEIMDLDNPISIDNFGLFNSWGRVSLNDQFHRPRLIKPTWGQKK